MTVLAAIFDSSYLSQVILRNNVLKDLAAAQSKRSFTAFRMT